MFWYIFGEWQFKPCGRCWNFRSGKVLSSRQKVSVDKGPFIFISIAKIFHVTPLPYSFSPPPRPRKRSLIGRFRIAFTVNVYFYRVAMFSRSSIDPPVETQSLFAAWIMWSILLSMLAAIHGCLQALSWPERKEGWTLWRDVLNKVFDLTIIEMSINCVDSHVEAYFSYPS